MNVEKSRLLNLHLLLNKLLRLQNLCSKCYISVDGSVGGNWRANQSLKSDLRPSVRCEMKWGQNSSAVSFQ